jgi:tetratricopeptide (TPR) repeat protein
VYQVPAATSLAMIRAFTDVFPQAVLLSGSQAELLLVGTTAPQIEVDPAQLQAALQGAPDVTRDLARLDLGTVTEIIGSFVGSAETLALATRDVTPVTDDRPRQEYGLRSSLGTSLLGVPASIIDLARLTDWCPRCVGDEGVTVGGLDIYLSLMFEAYNADAAKVAADAGAVEDRLVLGSRYLGAVLPESAPVYNAIGTGLLRAGRTDEARELFARAMQLDPASLETPRNIGHAQYVEGTQLLEQGRVREAIERFQAALGSVPDSAPLHNDLGIALATAGDLAQATEHFRQAVALDPGFAEARQNLERARAGRR